jgi:ADP-ribose pyrophosphatase
MLYRLIVFQKLYKILLNLKIMEKTVYNGSFVKVTEERINDSVWERVYFKSSVSVIPFNDKGQILFIKENRPHETPQTRIKLMGGYLDEGEEALHAADRELQEELGFKAKHLTIYYTYEKTGTANELKYYVVATQLIPSKLSNPDGEESVEEIIPMHINDIPKYVLDGNYPGLSGFVLLKLCEDIKNGNVKLSNLIF